MKIKKKQLNFELEYHFVKCEKILPFNLLRKRKMKQRKHFFFSSFASKRYKTVVLASGTAKCKLTKTIHKMLPECLQILIADWHSNRKQVVHCFLQSSLFY